MNVLELMDSKLSSFSKTERTIYESIKKFPDSFARESITEISESSGFSKPALTRFAQKLGFSGYTEFQFQFKNDIETAFTDEEEKSMASIYANILMRTEESLDKKELLPLIDKMRKAHIVYTKGTSLSRFPAEELALGLSLSSDIPFSYIQQDISYIHFKEDDVVIVFSARTGDSHQELCRRLRKKDIPQPYSVLVTTNSKHPIRHNFDKVICLPSVSMQDGKEAVLSDTFSFLLFNQILLKEIERIKPDSSSTTINNRGI